MGCGQSHIAVIYPRKGKSKNSASGGSGEESDDEGGGEDRAGGGRGSRETGGGGGRCSMEGMAASNPLVTEESPPSSETEEEQRLRLQISNSPLLQQSELSTSQSDFFKMLDEKINNGPDYVPPSDFEFAMDEATLCRLLQEWQAAKLRSRCGLPDLSASSGRTAHGRKLSRYHSLQSNGEPPTSHHQRKLHHQMSTSSHYGAPPHYLPQYYQPPPPPSQYPYAYHPGPPAPSHWAAAPPPPAGSVVTYDSRGGYFTELA